MRARACLVLGLLGVVHGCGSAGDPPETTLGRGGAGGIINGAGGGTTGIITTPLTTTTTSSDVGGSGGGAPTCPPTPPVEGPPISAPSGKWTWVAVSGSRCRDGSPTGVGIRLNPSSTKVAIYLEGGGACFNTATCAIALASFGKATFDAWAATVGQLGIFDDGAADNPIKDWNVVYVPYCSGDVHAGSASGADVPNGPQDQDFVGYENMGHYLGRLVPTFADATHVLLTGVSAGGFGAAFNYHRVAAAFCPIPVTLIDDSGPPLADDYLAPCLQKKWRELWNLAAALPTECADCTLPSGGGLVNYADHLAATWPNSRLGLISSTRDSVISTFFGYGADGCTKTTPIPGDVYAEGLMDLRDNHLSSASGWGSYYVDSTTHTYLIGPGFYLAQVNGVKLTQWMRDLLSGYPSHVGP